MAVTLTKEFWTNLLLFVVAFIALGLSIWGFATPCKDGFGNYPQQDCSKLQFCDKLKGKRTPGTYCLGACYAGCKDGTRATGQKCRRSVCYSNLTKKTDVCIYSY